MLTFRGRPPRGCCLAGGSIGPKMAHCSSVKSEGYFLRCRSFCTMCAHSSTDGICANYLINLLFCQALFPDSLYVWHQSQEQKRHVIAQSMPERRDDA